MILLQGTMGLYGDSSIQESWVEFWSLIWLRYHMNLFYCISHNKKVYFLKHLLVVWLATQIQKKITVGNINLFSQAISIESP